MTGVPDTAAVVGARLVRVRFARAAAGVGLALLAVAILGASSASARTRNSGFYIRGGGFGHGIGMSQYGAAGFALHGWTYQQILAHYYTDTTLATVSSSQIVTVLLHRGAATFTGATAISGSTTKLNPFYNYGVVPVNGQLQLIHGGVVVGTFDPPLKVSGAGPLTLVGRGQYRGTFIFRLAGGAVQTVNAVNLDDYVRGVVAAEMPASWGAAALEAQAVAARTYAVTSNVAPGDYRLYDDTRSQVYNGVSAETPTTDTAVQATAGQIVEYGGTPAITYFFSSSGGYTESVQNVWYGVTPEAWLVGQPDPYDDSYGNPYYRWSRKLSVSSADGQLGKYVSGSLRGIKVVQRGVSPRVVKAAVIGSRGVQTVTGDQLESALGTMSTYMRFTEIHDRGMVVSKRAARLARRAARKAAVAKDKSSHRRAQLSAHVGTGGSGIGSTTTTTTTTSTTTTSGATSITGTPTTTSTTTTPTTTTTSTTTTTAASGATSITSNPTSTSLTPTSVAGPPPPTPFLNSTPKRAGRYVQGAIFPAVYRSQVLIERRDSGVWKVVAKRRLGKAGAFRARVGVAGTYRVVYGSINGPWVRVR